MKPGSLGNVFIVVGLLLLLPWIGDQLLAAAPWPGYWRHVYVESYRGYAIYHFTEIGVYGYIPEEVYNASGGEDLPPGTGKLWKFAGSVEAAKRLIDDILSEPIYIESYKGWEIYRTPGTGLYYAVNSETGENTSKWDSIDKLKRYIDGPEGWWQLSLPGRVIEVGVEEELLIVERGKLVFDYITQKPDLVKKAWIVLKTSEGELLEEVKLDGPHEIHDLEGYYAYWASVKLPERGKTYRVEGYVDCWLRTIKMVDLQVEWGQPTSPLGESPIGRLYAWLRDRPLPGAALTVIGLLLKLDERLERRRR